MGTYTTIILTIIAALLWRIVQNQEKIMASIDDLISEVNSETTLIDSVGTLISGLKQQIADALASAGTKIPADVQAKIDQAFAQLEANKAKLAAAVQANTPAATGGSDTPPSA
jgi:hypothetical protein